MTDDLSLPSGIRHSAPFPPELSGCSRLESLEFSSGRAPKSSICCGVLAAFDGCTASSGGVFALPAGGCLIYCDAPPKISPQGARWAAASFTGVQAAALLAGAKKRTGGVFYPEDTRLFAALADGFSQLGNDCCADAALAFSLLMEVLSACRSKRAPGADIASAAAEYMRLNYAMLSGMDELAEKLGVSKAHLIRVFSASTGVPPNKYLTGVRMDAARALLSGSDYPLDIIASLTGYSDANYFCKVFKKYAGQTPGQYRKSASPDEEALGAIYKTLI